MARKIMIQGTMSSAGKSLIAAGLCRIFHQDGYRVAPFKSQNMALNSFVTADGLEMGRAQVMQAEAAGTAPTVDMNPILLKPTSDRGSQVIVRGEVLDNMEARKYFEYKTELIPIIKESFKKLEEEYDIIVIEGAGSPAEINLKKNDIVNMGIAKRFDANVLLVGDIDRGGVFAQLVGTLELLPQDEKDRVKGLVINKFRGDKTILDPGIDMLVDKCGVPVCGTVPYIKDLKIDDEDSLTERFNSKVEAAVDIAVIRLPHISNFTDFDVFDSISGCHVRYVDDIYSLGTPDIIMIPGSKNTIADMRWLRERSLDNEIKRQAEKIPVFGICGGFQILGETIEDEYGSDSGAAKTYDTTPAYVAENGAVNCSDRLIKINGLGLLPITTVMKKEKTRRQVSGRLPELEGVFAGLSGKQYSGYEIHMGDSEMAASVISRGNIYGTYIHGIFDDSDIAAELVRILAGAKGVDIAKDSVVSYKDFKEEQYDKLAEVLRENLDMEYIYSVM
ncbi:MAG: cobyric acid synthase [Eubacterium sp.]|nr:cobyric acid synthase [Eubacterium sp.]